MEEKEDQPIIEYDDKLNFTSQENIVPNISSLTEVDAKFQRMPSVLAIELVFVLLNNLSTFMIRSYKNSIPLLKRNIIILISYYLVEIVNFILIYQVWSNLIFQELKRQFWCLTCEASSSPNGINVN